FRNRIDSQYDVLSQIVAWSSLCPKDKHTRVHIIIRVLQEATVQGENVQQVQMLTLVLVQALDLYVKDRIRADLDASRFTDNLDQFFLVAAFYSHELVAEGFVFH